MTEIFEAVSKFGGLVILAGLFIYSYIQDKKDARIREEEAKKREAEDLIRETQNQELLKSVSQSNENIAKSIDAINNTTNVLKEYIIKHDERAKKIDDNIEYIKERIDKIC